ncbi:MAG TPA: class I SAM-dependent methyltransferase, partial [Gammaproteobacteria bacterium]|nr:class I SAM-dependent methyltransferase [Gammaproteobacteria bacterium]
MIEAVLAETPLCLDRALSLGAMLHCPVISASDPKPKAYLAVSPTHLEVRQASTKPILVDFLAPKFLHRLHSTRARDPLLRAVDLKPHMPRTIIDATAGFGIDACMLAYAGAHVTLVERDPIMGLLLQDGILRAQTSGELKAVANRMHVVLFDAKDYLKTLSASDHPDVIYLDPMFVHSKSALPNKNMQFLQQQAGLSHDADALLNLACDVARQRVVVKRALQAPP